MNRTDVSGADVVIAPRESSIDDVKFVAGELGVELTAATKSEFQALKDACGEYARGLYGKGFVIQSLKDRHRNGVECCYVERGEDGNDYPQKFKARVSQHTFIHAEGADQLAIQNIYRRHLSVVPVGNVRQFVEAALNRMAAVKIVPSFYWVPEENVEACHHVARACSKICTTYVMPKYIDEGDSLTLIADKITEFMERQRDRMLKAHEENNGDFDGRQEESLKLVNQLKAYEESLGITLDRAREAISAGISEVAMTADF